MYLFMSISPHTHAHTHTRTHMYYVYIYIYIHMNLYISYMYIHDIQYIIYRPIYLMCFRKKKNPFLKKCPPLLRFGRRSHPRDGRSTVGQLPSRGAALLRRGMARQRMEPRSNGSEIPRVMAIYHL